MDSVKAATESPKHHVHSDHDFVSLRWMVTE